MQQRPQFCLAESALAGEEEPKGEKNAESKDEEQFSVDAADIGFVCKGDAEAFGT